MPWIDQRWWTLLETCTWERRNTRQPGRSALPDWDWWVSTRAGWFQVCTPLDRCTGSSEQRRRRHRSGYCRALMELLERRRAGETVLPLGFRRTGWRQRKEEDERRRRTGEENRAMPRSSKRFGVQRRRRNKGGGCKTERNQLTRGPGKKRENASVNVIIRTAVLTIQHKYLRLRLCNARFYSGVNSSTWL